MAAIGEATAEPHRIAWEDPGPGWFTPARQTIGGLAAAAAAGMTDDQLLAIGDGCRPSGEPPRPS